MPSIERFRDYITSRAGGSCEYCRLLQDASGVTFHIEHAIPQSRGGTTVIANLVLSCPGCNLSKSNRIGGKTSTGKESRLFNPREYDPWLLGWHLHFVLNHADGTIAPRTLVGSTTIVTLRMNSDRRTMARLLQIRAGLLA